MLSESELNTESYEPVELTVIGFTTFYFKLPKSLFPAIQFLLSVLRGTTLHSQLSPAKAYCDLILDVFAFTAEVKFSFGLSGETVAENDPRVVIGSSWSGFCHTDRFHGNDHKPCIFCFRKL